MRLGEAHPAAPLPALVVRDPKRHLGRPDDDATLTDPGAGADRGFRQVHTDQGRHPLREHRVVRPRVKQTVEGPRASLADHRQADDGPWAFETAAQWNNRRALDD